MDSRNCTLTDRNCLDCKFKHEFEFETDEDTQLVVNYCQNSYSDYSEQPVMETDSCKYYHYKGVFN